MVCRYSLFRHLHKSHSYTTHTHTHSTCAVLGEQTCRRAFTSVRVGTFCLCVAVHCTVYTGTAVSLRINSINFVYYKTLSLRATSLNAKSEIVHSNKSQQHKRSDKPSKEQQSWQSKIVSTHQYPPRRRQRRQRYRFLRFQIHWHGDERHKWKDRFDGDTIYSRPRSIDT